MGSCTVASFSGGDVDLARGEAGYQTAICNIDVKLIEQYVRSHVQIPGHTMRSRGESGIQTRSSTKAMMIISLILYETWITFMICLP
jgi:hypothetical protein